MQANRIKGTIKTIKATEEYIKKYIKNKHNTEAMHLKKRITSLSLRAKTAKRQINNLPDLNVKVHHTNTLKKVNFLKVWNACVKIEQDDMLWPLII